MKRPCINCGVVIASGTRCKQCAAARTASYVGPPPRKSTTERGYDYRWRKLSKEAIARQPYCSVCGTTKDLTGDHRDPTKRKNLTLADVDVLCRAHNSSKKNRIY